ncbi:MAG: hypothetical protein AAGK22_06400, partial [Acidobacteriota bacterium]
VRSIDGLHVGRFDLKTPSLRHLLCGQELKILELNLTGSLPLHVWDECLSWRETLRELDAHWQPVADDNRRRGVRELPWKDALEALYRRHRRSTL